MTNRRDSRSTSDASAAQTPEQRRAADALRAVRALGAGADDSLRARYRAYADRLGPAILMNGLGQALATERAAAGGNPTGADERAHDKLYRNLEAWLCRAGGVYEPASEDGDLLRAIVQGSEADYLRAQAEALAWLIWHKKFCRAYLPAPEGEES